MVVNKSEEDDTPTRYTRRTKTRQRVALESQVATDLYTQAGQKRNEASALGLDEE